RLTALLPLYRRCFAIWCVHEACESYRPQPGDQIAFVSETVSELWEATTAGKNPSPDLMTRLKHECLSVQYDYKDFISSELMSQLVTGLSAVADLFITDEPRKAALAAETVINCIHAIESERRGISPRGDISEVHEVAVELESQDRMLRYLETSPTLLA